MNTDHQHTVLVVDDDAATRAAMMHLLEMEGFNVTCAINGRDALDSISQARPTVVLSDVRMPEMDGEQLVAAVQERDGPPIILMTAHDLIDEARAAQIGAAGLLKKPIDLDDVVELIGAVVSRASA